MPDGPDEISGPILRRMKTRLDWYKLHSAYLKSVTKIEFGPLMDNMNPNLFVSEPVMIGVHVYPTKFGGAIEYTSTTSFRGQALFTVLANQVLTEDRMFQWYRTIDDVVKIVSELELKTLWAEMPVPSEYGERIKIQGQSEGDITYPETGDASRIAIMRLEFQAWIAWES